MFLELNIENINVAMSSFEQPKLTSKMLYHQNLDLKKKSTLQGLFQILMFSVIKFSPHPVNKNQFNWLIPAWPVATSPNVKQSNDQSDELCFPISDIAEACLFLASDKSRYITGTTLEVAGKPGEIERLLQPQIQILSEVFFLSFITGFDSFMLYQAY